LKAKSACWRLLDELDFARQVIDIPLKEARGKI